MPPLQLLGRVIGTAMQKTAKVQVDRYAMHPLYKKIVRHTKNYLAHDAESRCLVGDVVRIRELPQKVSKRKAFEVVEIVKPVPKYVDAEQNKMYTPYEIKNLEKS